MLPYILPSGILAEYLLPLTRPGYSSQPCPALPSPALRPLWLILVIPVLILEDSGCFETGTIYTGFLLLMPP